MSFYIQLYTIREETAKDFIGTLEKLAGLGYAGVEFAGYGGIAPGVLAAKLKELGLKAPSSHVGLDRLANDFEGELAYAKALELDYLIIPGAPMSSAEDAMTQAPLFNEYAKRLKAEGITLAYHNHHKEFNTDGEGRYIFDILMEQVPDLAMELDVYWAQYADVDVLGYIHKWQDRCRLIHVKDMDNLENKSFADAGTGCIDFPGIIAAAANADYFVYEQEGFAGDIWYSVEQSLKNMKPLLAGR